MGRDSSSWYRRFAKPALIGLTAALASCNGLAPGLLASLESSAAPGPSPSGVTGSAAPTAQPGPVGGILAEGDGRQTPRPNAGPASSPSPAPASTDAPQGPFALLVRVDPATAAIRFKAADPTLPAVGPSEVQLGAEITLTNGLKTSRVTWMSSAPAIASVDELGLVRAGTVEGSAHITAVAAFKTLDGGEATGSCLVTVSGKGDVDLVVE